MTTTPESSRPSPRPGLAMVVWGVGSVVVGGLLAPHVFNGLLWLGRTCTMLASLREVELTRVTSRCVMLVALGALWPTLRRCGLTGWAAVGLRPAAGGMRSVAQGALLGVLSLLILFGLGWMLGAYQVTSRGAAWAVKQLPIYLGAGLLVGGVEELVFRGVLYGGLRRAARRWSAALISSLVYSLAHFIKPLPPAEPVVAYWYSGLALFRHAFALFSPVHAPWPLAVTLFLVGMILCRLYERTRTLYLVIGLHAGWVWLIQIGSVVFRRDVEAWPRLFGDSALISKSPAALALALVFAMLVYGVGAGSARAAETDHRVA